MNPTTADYEAAMRRMGKMPQLPTKPARAKRGTGKHSVGKRRQLAKWRWARDMLDLPGVFIPDMRLVSAMNAREHWAKRSARAKQQRAVATEDMCLWYSPLPPRLPARVTITRYGPRKLDSDNLAASAKAVRDGVADWFGVDDGSDQYEWVYQQELAPAGCFGVRIEIERIGGGDRAA
jgi:hypothetical protein